MLKRVIAIDPGSLNIAIVCLREDERGDPVIEYHFYLKYKSTVPIHLRCGKIFEDVRHTFRLLPLCPNVVMEETIEDFVNKNPKTDAVLHMGTGAIMAGIYHAGGFEIKERYKATEWIEEFIGYKPPKGKSKELIKQTAIHHFGEEAIRDFVQDEIDALALAWYHWQRMVFSDERGE